MSDLKWEKPNVKFECKKIIPITIDYCKKKKCKLFTDYNKCSGCSIGVVWPYTWYKRIDFNRGYEQLSIFDFI